MAGAGGAAVSSMYQARNRAGSSTKQGSRMDGTALAYYQPRTKRMKPGSFHAKLLKYENALHHYFSDNTFSQGMTHNTLYTLNLTSKLLQDVTQGGRVGQEIHLLNLRVDCFLQNPVSSSNGIQYRLITLFSDIQTNAIGFASGLGVSQIFGGQSGQTGSVFTSTGITDPQRVTVVDDRHLVINPQVANIQDTINCNFVVPLHRKFIYETGATGGIFGKTKNLYFVIVACIPGGTTGTTNVGQLNFNADLLYKNSV